MGNLCFLCATQFKLCHTPQSQLFWRKQGSLLAAPGTESIPLPLRHLWGFSSTLHMSWWVEASLYTVLKYLLVL